MAKQNGVLLIHPRTREPRSCDLLSEKKKKKTTNGGWLSLTLVYILLPEPGWERGREKGSRAHLAECCKDIHSFLHSFSLHLLLIIIATI